MLRNVNIWTNLDWVTVILYLILIFMGWANIYSAVFSEEHQNIFDLSQRYGKQLLWIVAALFLAFSFFTIDSRFYSEFAFVFYGLIILLLLAVLVFGTKINGARSWFEVGSFRIQPAEFAKFATGLALAKFLSNYNKQIHAPINLIKIASIVLLPAVLISFQPDTGSALVYMIFIFVLYREGLSGRFLMTAFLLGALFVLALTISFTMIIIIIVIGTLLFYSFQQQQFKDGIIVLISISFLTLVLFGVKYFFDYTWEFHHILGTATIISAFFALLWALRYNLHKIYFFALILLLSVPYIYSSEYLFNNVLREHQQKRVNILLGKEKDVYGAGYNVNQSKIAIGSGGAFGKGFLRGTQTKYNFVPEQATDFIFCTVGEEWGFAGSTLVIFIFLVLMLRLIFLAERQRNPFSRIYGYAVVAILFFHFAINIGMTIGAVPIIGIPLPFFSYGGSSLWAFTILLFIFIRLDATRMELL